MLVPVSEFQKKLSDFVENENFALLNVSPVFEYLNGERTERVIGYKYKVADPDLFLNFDVKVLGKDAIIEQKEIDILSKNNDRLYVCFVNAILRPFSISYGKVNCTIVADNVKFVE